MTTNEGSGKSVFARYIVDSPPEAKQRGSTLPRGPLLQPIVPPTDHKSPPIEKCLDWLVNRWPKPAVGVRDICRFGPNPIRDRKSAIATAEILVEHGWLAPIKARQHNMKMWEVVRRPTK
jgi:hypothetical protein